MYDLNAGSARTANYGVLTLAGMEGFRGAGAPYWFTPFAGGAQNEEIDIHK